MGAEKLTSNLNRYLTMGYKEVKSTKILTTVCETLPRLHQVPVSAQTWDPNSPEDTFPAPASTPVLTQ